MIWVLSQNPIFKKHIGWFAISFFLNASPQAQSQTLNIKDMIQMEANFFTMGSGDFLVEEPEHKVCLNSYYLGIYEVIQQKFGSVMG
jgi:formylglycine-generating enzyme required for sulfatase activity